MDERKKKIITRSISAIILGLVAILAIIVLLRNRDDDKMTTYSSSDQVEKSRNSSIEGSEEPTESDKNVLNYAKALSTLEKSDEPINDEDILQQVREDLDVSIKYINSIKKITDLRGSEENKLYLTDVSNLYTVGMMLNINHYKLEDIELYRSNADDVYQFVMKFTKDGEDNCYWAGNYSNTRRFFQFASYHGGNIGAAYG